MSVERKEVGPRMSQIVIHGYAQHSANVAWQFHRTAIGGRRQRPAAAMIAGGGSAGRG